MATKTPGSPENLMPENPPEDQAVKLHRLDPRRKSLLIATGLLTALGCAGWTAALQVMQPTTRTELALSAAGILALLATAWMILRTSARITQLEFWIRRMGGGDLDYTLPPRGHDEFTEIAYDLEVLRQRSIRSQQLDVVRRLSEELEDKNRALETTLQELHDAQDQMISRQKLAEIGELAAGIAHEVRNPLNIMANFAGASRELMAELQDELQEQRDDARETVEEILGELTENMSRIESNCERASRIIQDVTNMSRSSTGQQRPAEINKLVHDYTMLAYQAARSQDRGFNVRIVEDLDEEAGEIVCVPEELSRVFINLASNACYATRKKRDAPGGPQDYEPTMWVSTRRRGGNLEVRVRDNGTGIPEEMVSRIFNPFFTTKPTNEGTGLGLSLSHEIVRRHGGSIEVETEPGEYTEMRVELPLQPARMAHMVAEGTAAGKDG